MGLYKAHEHPVLWEECTVCSISQSCFTGEYAFKFLFSREKWGQGGTPCGVCSTDHTLGSTWLDENFFSCISDLSGSWSTRESCFTRESHETRLSRASSILWCSQHRFNSGSQTLRTVLGYKDEWPRLERAYAVRGMGARWCWDELCSGNRRKSTFNWAGRGWRRARGIQIPLVRLHETYKTYTSCPEVNRKKSLCTCHAGAMGWWARWWRVISKVHIVMVWSAVWQLGVFT